MADPETPGFDHSLRTLDEATRLLASEMEEDRLVDRALNAFAEFGRAERVALLRIDESVTGLEVVGGLNRGKRLHTKRHVPTKDSPLEEVIRDRRTGGFPLSPDDELPLPALSQASPGVECLCLPLIGNHRLVMGVITLECRTDSASIGNQREMLSVLATVLAVSLENARLFQLATVDGLTNLYTRRYFDMRLEEEIARVARHGGSLALLITDFDQFKIVNDRYGHQQGDHVLSKLASLLRATVRKGVDLPCRYGGEEFATILPVTDRNGACEMAERVRRSCEQYRFPSSQGPIAITLSGGVATMDREHPLTCEELIRRADEALYEAKARGRNQICAWSGSRPGSSA